MNTSHRLGRRDWLTGLGAGAILGFLFLGIGSRAGMRLVALASGQAPAFSIEGSIAVALLGALTGAALAAVFLFVRIILPTRQWTRGAIFWMVCAALVLRGLRPVTPLNAGIFIPLFVAHGVLLHAFWCRVHLARTRRAGGRS